MEAQKNCNFENNSAEPKTENKKQGSLYECSTCKYTTNRKFNLDRHNRRIHEVLQRKYHCCGKEISTKGEYYLHVETYHPQTRAKAEISRNKYKIVPEEKGTCEVTDKTNPLIKQFLAKLTADQLAYLEDINFDDFPRL